MIIEQPPSLLRRLYPRSMWRMESSERVVYLTFDDGPIPEATPWVLDVLDRYGVKATFFVVGDNVRRYPEVFAEVLRRGHSVGNHTFHHISGHIHGNYHFNTDVRECQDIIDAERRRILGSEPEAHPLFRPPHGWMKPKQYRYVARHYRVIMWDLVTRDYSSCLTPDCVLRNIRKYARNGSIITFHDSLKSIEKLRTALPASIEWLISQGYRFEKL